MVFVGTLADSVRGAGAAGSAVVGAEVTAVLSGDPVSEGRGAALGGGESSTTTACTASATSGGPLRWSQVRTPKAHTNKRMETAARGLNPLFLELRGLSPGDVRSGWRIRCGAESNRRVGCIKRYREEH